MALGKAHQRGLVHKDVKPANILVDCADGLTRLTGFGIASRLPRERQMPEPPEFIAGTLAYMAPEQTGRMNRSIDSRSDLYALGVTFYQMLTGSLPFSAVDPIEWVHCHIARKPVAPTERLKSVPAVIGLSEFHFARKFRTEFSCPPHAHLMRMRIERAKAQLARGNIPLKVVAANSGFSDQSHMTRLFRRVLGVTPAEYRNAS